MRWFFAGASMTNVVSALLVKAFHSPPERLHALLQAAFAGGVDAAEQQVFEQVRQLLVCTAEVIEADADHQANRHMPAFVPGLSSNLQTVGQRVALDLKAVQGKRRE